MTVWKSGIEIEILSQDGVRGDILSSAFIFLLDGSVQSIGGCVNKMTMDAPTGKFRTFDLEDEILG